MIWMIVFFCFWGACVGLFGCLAGGVGRPSPPQESTPAPCKSNQKEPTRQKNVSFIPWSLIKQLAFTGLSVARRRGATSPLGLWFGSWPGACQTTKTTKIIKITQITKNNYHPDHGFLFFGGISSFVGCLAGGGEEAGNAPPPSAKQPT